jgi:transcriptional regulator with XRE-family HTH domain
MAKPRIEAWQLPVHKACERIRYAIGWSKARMAQEIGITLTTWRRYEAGRTNVSINTLDIIREVTGIDPYVLAYSLYCDISKLPKDVREAHAALHKAWEKAIEDMHRDRQKLPTSWW